MMLLNFPYIFGFGSLAAGGLLAHYATYGVRSQLLGATDWLGRTDTGEVALTFDDGPSAETEMLLDALAESGVKATFFMVGSQVERFPATARRIVACGHEIGNHSYSHPIFLYRSPRETRWQLERTQEIISQVTGVRPRLARPPCGVRTPAYFKAAHNLGLRTVQWSATGFDWKKRAAQRIAHDVVRHATAGSIILLHDGDSAEKENRGETIASIPLIVAGLRTRGLHIAPLLQLLPEERLNILPNSETSYE